MKKNKGIAILAVVLAAIVGLAYYASIIISSTGKGENQNITLGLDLAGGVSITYQVMDEDATDEEISDTVHKLQKRVEGYSTEATVYPSGNDRINVEIPGVSDANKILEELGTPGSLEFVDPDGNVFMTGTDVADAQPASFKDEFGNASYSVELTLNDEAAVKFAEVTGENIGKQLPIIYDGEVISSPYVESKIGGGIATITGMANYEEAANLASSIRIGALSLTLEEMESQVVGAQLGANAIETALTAAAIGLIIIMLFMIVCYRISGVASSLALMIYSTLVVAVLYWFDITLTLPGIAGIILGIGMAVDANVIIFARIREEIAAGKSIFSSIRDGFKKAQSAILDGNITTLIAAAVLAARGSGTVKGFAYTLAIGIVVSMFTALFVTRFVLYALYGVGFKNEKFYGRAKERKEIQFVEKRKYFYIISAVLIIVGFVGMGVHSSKGDGALNYSLEFVGGTTTTVEFAEDYTLEQIDAEMVPLVYEVTGDNDIFIQKVTGGQGVIFKTKALTLPQREALNQIFVDNYGVDENTISSQTIGATISSEMTEDAIAAVIIAVILMLVYIAFRFRDFRFAACAVGALVHDILVVLTCYALMRISVGSTFIAVMLTILGYSINDTIVVFDRIRENIHGKARVSVDELKAIGDKSITQTISRSINTSLTTFVMVALLYFLGVAAMKDFALPLMVGVICGTYSSICIATELWFDAKVKIKSKKAE